MESGDELDGLKRVLKNSTTLDKNEYIHTVFLWCHAQHRCTKYSYGWRLFGSKLAQLFIHVSHRPQSSVEKGNR